MRNTLFADENEQLLGMLILFALATFVLPAMAPHLATSAGAWLRGHGILVDAQHALFTIPYLAAGPDAQRLTVAVLLCIAVAALRMWTHRPATKGSRGDA